jgi:hypothetical protein
MRPLYHSNKNSHALTVESPMYKSLLLSFILVVAVLAFGCAKSESTTNRDAAAPAPSKPATSPATTTASSSSDSIGVAECDAFLKSYEACVKDKVPEAQRATFNTGLAQWRKSWHDLAQNPQTKATLASICKTQLDNAKQSMKAYNCTF